MTDRPVLVGVDAGGTSTRSVVVDHSGRCRGLGRAGSGNPTAVGVEAASAAVTASVGDALAAAGLAGDRVDAVLLAMAGAATTSPLDAVRRGLAGLGVDAPVTVEGDLLALYFSGTPRHDGYALVAGTGAAAVRVEEGRLAATSDGLGWLLGDDGSGFWIGRRVARAALADLDGRGPSTALTGLLLDRLDLAAPATGDRAAGRDVVLRALRQLYAGRPVQLAGFAPLAFEAGNDPVASVILDEAAAALGHTLRSVILPGIAGPVVLGGGLLTHRRDLVDRLVADLAAQGSTPRTAVVPDGVLGVATSALRRAGVAVDEDVFTRVARSLAELR